MSLIEKKIGYNEKSLMIFKLNSSAENIHEVKSHIQIWKCDFLILKLLSAHKSWCLGVSRPRIIGINDNGVVLPSNIMFPPLKSKILKIP